MAGDIKSEIIKKENRFTIYSIWDTSWENE